MSDKLSKAEPAVADKSATSQRPQNPGQPARSDQSRSGRDYGFGVNDGSNPDLEIGRYVIDRDDPAVFAAQKAKEVEQQLADASKQKQAFEDEYLRRHTPENPPFPPL